MPGSWNPATYRERARKWREAADALPPGDEREACMSMARRYSELAAVMYRSADVSPPARPTAEYVPPVPGGELSGAEQ
jgi:hypothetical protein